ncbi:hypothetical protein Zm00014a_039433 [Zea mays]|uniref:Uncharacterized protein n=1 Tax=Zea mays TaxID=4577 RepID=A0A3L6E2L6_MAIZE|nr:hypothetical protein Zm00014a_039433 [Zea mays]
MRGHVSHRPHSCCVLNEGVSVRARALQGAQAFPWRFCSPCPPRYRLPKHARKCRNDWAGRRRCGTLSAGGPKWLMRGRKTLAAPGRGGARDDEAAGKKTGREGRSQEHRRKHCPCPWSGQNCRRRGCRCRVGCSGGESAGRRSTSAGAPCRSAPTTALRELTRQGITGSEAQQITAGADQEADAPC